MRVARLQTRCAASGRDSETEPGIRDLDDCTVPDQRQLTDHAFVDISTAFSARRLAGIDLTKPRMQAALESLLSLSAQPDGFTVDQLASAMSVRLATEVTSRHASYDLRKFRGRNLVRGSPGHRRYEVSPEGLRPLVALWVP